MKQEKQYETDYKDFIELLNKHGVEYMIIGAYAAIYHTNIPRDTEDIDFWINKTKENAEKCARAIKEFNKLNVNADDLLGEKEIFFLGVKPHRIDIFNEQGDLHFSKAYTEKKVGEFRGAKTFFISRKDLITLKEYFHRDQDIKDLRRLYKAAIAEQATNKHTEEIKHSHHRHY